jgi:hypothetical protein
MAWETAPRPRANRVIEEARIKAAAETLVEERSDAVGASPGFEKKAVFEDRDSNVSFQKDGGARRLPLIIFEKTRQDRNFKF